MGSLKCRESNYSNSKNKVWTGCNYRKSCTQLNDCSLSLGLSGILSRNVGRPHSHCHSVSIFISRSGFIHLMRSFYQMELGAGAISLITGNVDGAVESG